MVNAVKRHPQVHINWQSVECEIRVQATCIQELICHSRPETHIEQGDCDDRNSTVNPGARERSLDGLDSNCDGDELPKLGPNRFEEAKGIIDTDKDGALSLEEFSAACARS